VKLALAPERERESELERGSVSMARERAMRMKDRRRPLARTFVGGSHDAPARADWLVASCAWVGFVWVWVWLFPSGFQK
jgi:hypothetical protein